VSHPNELKVSDEKNDWICLRTLMSGGIGGFQKCPSKGLLAVFGINCFLHWRLAGCLIWAPNWAFIMFCFVFLCKFMRISINVGK